jgi:hypothetical protein
MSEASVPFVRCCGIRSVLGWLQRAPDDPDPARLFEDEADQRLSELVQLGLVAVHWRHDHLALVRHLLTPP